MVADLPWLLVAWYAFLSAVATGLGALPFLAVSDMSRRLLGLSNALAAGLMGAASWSLIYEGLEFSMWRTVAGMLAGLLGIVLSHKWVEDREGMQWGELEGVDAMKILLILGVMTAHSFTEGVGIGVSFGGGTALGGFITTAIAVHNIPEGTAITVALRGQGVSTLRCMGWAVVSSVPQPVGAVPAAWMVWLFEPLLPAGLGFAAGAMMYLVVDELLEEAYADAGHGLVAISFMVGLVIMVMLGRVVGIS
jgi:zinc transporter ZupT